MNDNAINNLTSAICALIEAISMVQENEWRKSQGQPVAYREDVFLELIGKHNLTGF